MHATRESGSLYNHASGRKNIIYAGIILAHVIFSAIFCLGVGYCEGRAMNSTSGSEECVFDEDPAIINRWEITVQAGALREFIYTNHAASHFSSESAGPNRIR